MSDMYDRLKAFGLGLPEAWEDHPWGETALKVRKKVFVFLWREEGSARFSLTVKLPLSAADALELPFAEPTGYGLGKHGWVTLKPPEDHGLGEPELTAWIVESYKAVAPKTLGRQVEI